MAPFFISSRAAMSRRRKVIPQEIVEVEINALSHDGRGIARLDNKIMFVFGALPGETVRAKYTASYSKYSEATAIEIVVKSQERVTPPCDHFGVCGGCQMQHLQTSKQIQHKLDQSIRSGRKHLYHLFRILLNHELHQP